MAAATGTAPVGGAELKSHYPQRCGSTPEVRLAPLHDPVEKAAPQLPHLGDVDQNHIAILVDDGSLIAPPDAQGIPHTNSGNIQSRFFASHANIFTYLCIFTASTFTADVEPEAGFAFEQNLSNNVQNIGLSIFNPSAVLKSRLNMNDLGEYPEDPSEEMPAFLNFFSGVDVLGQEAEHMVGAFVQANNADILGRGNAHWSYFFETYGSVMEGNRWRDNGGGLSWTTVAAATGYTQLDNYLYGFLLPAGVTDPMVRINNPVPDLVDLGGEAAPPAAGVTVASSGPTTVTINNIITAMGGARIPDANSSPRTFKMAFLLVIPAGTTAAPYDLEKIDDFRVQWENFFRIETNAVGTMDTQLGAVPVTANFESHEFTGPPGLTVHFDNDSFGSSTGFLWNFGDGNTSTERHPVHTYTSPGAFNVALTVSGTGGPVTITKPAFVRVGTETVYFSDDFEADRGWTRDPLDTATTGMWERADPEGTFISATYGNDVIRAAVQPEDDHTPAGGLCLVTGAAAGSGPGAFDVDGGVTTIVSPVVDLSTANNPVLDFWHWYTNNDGAGSGRDSLCVDVSNDGGSTWKRARTFHSSHHYWRQEQVRLIDLITLTANVRVRFRAGDEGIASLVEAAIDDVRIVGVRTPTDVAGPAGPARFGLERNRPNPFGAETRIDYTVPAPGGRVGLRVYSVDGRLVRTLVQGWMEPGPHSVSWNGRNDDGAQVGRGVYFYRLETPQGTLARKLFFGK